ncbi:MAG: aldo/keto reductase, partial [Planctomycetaceae bacterium]
SEGISVCVYWPLLKGLLSGRLSRDHIFADGDGRKKYPMFQGQEWQRNQDLVDELRELASVLGISLTTLVVAWTVQQSGVTAALCGAKRAWQISESAAGGDFRLGGDVMAAVERALSRRGAAQTRAAV